MEFGIYQLMKEIDRLHGGFYCKCAFLLGCCHRFPIGIMRVASVTRTFVKVEIY